MTPVRVEGTFWGGLADAASGGSGDPRENSEASIFDNPSVDFGQLAGKALPESLGRQSEAPRRPEGVL